MIEFSFVDSHTGGEPTRIVTSGIPDLGGGSVAEQAAVFGEKYDRYRSAIVNEPRGNNVFVGGIVVPSSNPSADLGVIFFNNVGVIGMCGHGTIGLMATFEHLGPKVVIETPVGLVTATRLDGGQVAVENVRSYVIENHVTVDVPGFGVVQGSIAYGGNTFFLCHNHPWQAGICVIDAPEMTRFSERVRKIVNETYPMVDHIELFAPPAASVNDSRNFVLCPGGEYDRSPCGTGTSAKLAWLFHNGKLQPGMTYRQESVVGSVFDGTFVPDVSGGVLPTISGRAFITAKGILCIDPEDIFGFGFPS